jgi:hypothetical protein
MTPTLEQIRQAGLDALRERLGVVGMIRFLQLFDNGTGDYAKERHKWVDETSLEDLVRQIKARRRRTTRTYHVVSHKKGWAVCLEGRSRARSIHATKREAIRTARDLAANQQADLVIHDRD